MIEQPQMYDKFLQASAFPILHNAPDLFSLLFSWNHPAPQGWKLGSMWESHLLQCHRNFIPYMNADEREFFLSMSAHDCTWWPVHLLERIKDAANKRPEQHPSHLMATRFFLQALVEKEILLQITIVFSPKWFKLVPEMNISEECFFFAYTASNTRPYVLSQTCFPECIIACHAFACFHVCVRIYVI